MILHQKHIYLSEPLVQNADDTILTALLAHGIAHHELNHHRKRGIVRTVMHIPWIISAFFVPGLHIGVIVTDPIIKKIMSSKQEYTSDAKAVGYLESLGYSATDYIKALEFLSKHSFKEQTGSFGTEQKNYGKRIKKIKKRYQHGTAIP